MSNKDDIVIVTDKGKAYTVPAYHIPIVSKAAMGKYLNNYVTFEDGEKVVKVFAIAHGDTTHQLLMVTKNGLAKRISLENMTIRKNGLKVITLNDDDGLASVILTTGEGSVVLVSRNGFAVHTGMENIPLTSRTAKGNIAMRFKTEDDYIISAVSTASDDTLLVVSDKGLCKRCSMTDIPQKKGRGGKGITIYKPTPKSGHAMAVVKADEDETLFVVTTNDMIIRTPVKDISTQSRSGHGVKAINLADGAEIASITLAPSEEAETIEESAA
jgi:DNA gyrase subunit A